MLPAVGIVTIAGALAVDTIDQVCVSWVLILCLFLMVVDPEVDSNSGSAL